MRAARGQRVEVLCDHVRMPACIRGKCKLVPGPSERSGERKPRPEVTVEWRRAEEDSNRGIIAHGKNRVARIVCTRDGDV